MTAMTAALRRHAPALAGYSILTAVFFWPVVSHFTTRILSNGEDGAAYLWNMWAIPRAILRGDGPFSTTDLFFPTGARTAFNTNTPFEAVASWPLQKVFGLGVAANVFQLGAVILSGLGTYLLALHVCGDRRAAFVAGVAFAFMPYRFAHASGHFSLNHTEFLPFGLLALLRLYEHPGRGRAAAFGVVAGLTFLTDLYYTVFLLLGAAVVAAWHWRRTATREMALRLVQSGVVAGLVGLPLLVAMVRELVVYDYLDPLTNWANADNYSADLLSWVTPSVLQRVWGDTFAGIDRAVTGGERLAFPGYVVLALAAAGSVVGARGRRGLWLAVFGAFFLLSFGPFLHVNGDTGARFHVYGQPFSIPMPYFVLHFVPVLNGVRVPGRFSVVAILALGVLAALALARLASWRPRLALIGPAVATVLLVVEFFPALVPTQPVGIPRAYRALAADPDRGAVMEIPLQWRTGFNAYGDVAGDHTRTMYYATRHGRPLVGGMVARLPQRLVDDFLTTPLYRQVVNLETDEGEATFTAADLRQMGIGFVVYHRDRPRPRAERYVASLGLRVLADDGTVVVWKVPRA